LLQFDGASDGFDHRGKLGDQTVACCIGDPAIMVLGHAFEDTSRGLEIHQRIRLICGHDAAVADRISVQDGG